MTTSFNRLAPELVLAIGEALEDESRIETTDTDEDEQKQRPAKNKDLLSLSAASRALRSTLAPLLYRSVNLSNTEKSIEYCRQIADSAAKAYVKELHFSASTYLPDPYERNDEDSRNLNDVEGCLPHGAIAILSDLTCFPQLEKLVVKFAYDDHNWWSMAYEDDWPDIESEGEGREQEATEAWRALPAKAFLAISDNKPGVIKHFEYRNAFPRVVTSWWTKDFAALLGGLESFKISLAGGDNGAGWQINTASQYAGFVSQLGEAFFDELHSIKRLDIAASDSGPIGCDSYRNAAYALPSKGMPHLRELRLEQVFIDWMLHRFFKAHSGVLEVVEMRNCYASQEDCDWHALFNAIAANDPQQLTRFSLEPKKTDFDPQFCEVSEEDQARVRQAIQENPSKRLFPFAYLDDKYGFTFDVDDASLASFMAGEDQRAWDSLQDLITRNNSQRGV